MKILVAIKRVADPDNANKVKPQGDKVDTTGLEWKLNPFDEYALETALRLTENGKTKARSGEVVVITIGPKDTETQLRSALATGADRAIRIDAEDANLDGRLVAKALKSVVEAEKPDLVLLGKQVVDGDSNSVAQMLAELLDFPMATFAATIKQEADGKLVVGREVDGGVATLRLTAPALISVDLRIVAPTSVYSSSTDASFKYNEGVRFAALPAIMKAKKKPLDVKTLAEAAGTTDNGSSYSGFHAPPARSAGVKVPDVATLVSKLATEAKVI